MVGRWEVQPGNPWHVILYVDERATAAQKDAITAVFLGRAGGLPGRGYGPNIVEVHEVRSAAIDLDHTPAREKIDVAPFLTVRAREAVPHDFTITCAIPGHDHAGQEIRARDLPRTRRRRTTGRCAGSAGSSPTSRIRRRPDGQLLFWQVSVVRSHEKPAFAPWMPSVVPTVTIASPPSAGTRNRTDLLTTSKSNDVDFV